MALVQVKGLVPSMGMIMKKSMDMDVNEGLDLHMDFMDKGLVEGSCLAMDQGLIKSWGLPMHRGLVTIEELSQDRDWFRAQAEDRYLAMDSGLN